MAKILILWLSLVVSAASNAKMQLLTFHSPPLVNYHHENHTHKKEHFTGFSIDLVDTLFQTSNQQYSIQSKPIKRALFDALNKTNTCTFPIDRTQERESKYKWIGPVAINRYAFYSDPNTTIPLTTLSDAKPYPLAVYAGTGIANYLAQREFEMYETKSLEQGLQMLRNNRVKLWVADTNSAMLLAENLDISALQPELIFFTSISFMACNINTPDKELNQLDETLREMYKSGKAQSILNLAD